MLSFWTDAIYELMFKIVTRMLLRPILAYKKRTSLVFDLQVVEVGSPLTFYLPLLCLLFFLFYLHVLFTFHIVLFVFFSCSNRRESWPWSNITIARRRSPDVNRDEISQSIKVISIILAVILNGRLKNKYCLFYFPRLYRKVTYRKMKFLVCANLNKLSGFLSILKLNTIC